MSWQPCCCDRCESCTTGKADQYTVTFPTLTPYGFPTCGACALASGATVTLSRVHSIPLYMTNIPECNTTINSKNDLWQAEIGSVGGCDLQVTMCINGSVGMPGSWQVFVYLGFTGAGGQSNYWVISPRALPVDCHFVDLSVPLGADSGAGGCNSFSQPVIVNAV